MTPGLHTAPRRPRLRLALCGLIVLAQLAPPAIAQGTVDPPATPPAQLEQGRIWSVRVPYASREDIQRLSRWIDHMRVDKVGKTLATELDSRGVERLRSLGYAVEIDVEGSERIRGFQQQRQQLLKLGKPGDPPFEGNAACYRTVEQANLDIDALAARYPKLVRVAPVGQTWVQTQLLSFRNVLIKYLPQSVVSLIDFDLLPDSKGNPLRAVVIGNQDRIQERTVPRMVTTSSIHAREYTPAEISTRFTEWLVKNHGIDPTATWLLDHNEFHFILHANPDGRKLAEQAVPQSFGSGWRKNVNLVEGYCKTSDDPFLSRFTDPIESGVDLNRNFPFGWNSTNGAGSSGDACEQTFRGPSAASEPETAAIVRYVAGTRQQDGNFTGGLLRDRRTAAADDFATGAPGDYEGLYLDIHSFSQLVLWPWGIRRESLRGDSKTANDDGMAAFAQRLAWYNGYAAKQIIDYDTDGTTTDTFYGELGAPSFTIELGTSFYEPCEEFEQNTFPKNVASLRYAARTLKAPYQLPLGPDAADIQLSAATVRQGESVTLTATIDDDRYLYEQGDCRLPVTRHDPQPIQAANAYINTPPWDGAARAIPLRATADTAFGAGPRVKVSGVIDTSAFMPGKHLLYVQGINQKGRAGPPDAVFLEVLAKDAPQPCASRQPAA
ncbi:M14 family zinc carboxypeptidase [Variovorax sp.]|uniref:M14 family zinc carboxypeptidase n=1 Tax=Variovorax sp. TaxID=1871043 RepID=UPI003BA8A02B